jgi:hypothetical protein
LRNDDDDDDGRREEALPPFQRENISSSSKDAFFLLFCLCAGLVVEIFSEIFFNDKRAKKLSFASLSLLSWVQVSLKRARELSTTTKIQKKREKELERENQKSFLFPTTTSYISLSSARERWKR